MCRDSDLSIPGAEVTISYEDVIVDSNTASLWNHATDDLEVENNEYRERDKRYSLCLHASLGGSLLVAECRCGYPFCCGDLARRFYCRRLLPEDYYLLFVKEYAPFVFMGRLAKLNKKYILQKRLSDSKSFDPLSFEISDLERKELIEEMYYGAKEVKAMEITQLALDALYKQGCQVGFLDKM